MWGKKMLSIVKKDAEGISQLVFGDRCQDAAKVFEEAAKTSGIAKLEQLLPEDAGFPTSAVETTEADEIAESVKFFADALIMLGPPISIFSIASNSLTLFSAMVS